MKGELLYVAFRTIVKVAGDDATKDGHEATPLRGLHVVGHSDPLSGSRDGEHGWNEVVVVAPAALLGGSIWFRTNAIAGFLEPAPAVARVGGITGARLLSLALEVQQASPTRRREIEKG